MTTQNTKEHKITDWYVLVRTFLYAQSKYTKMLYQYVRTRTSTAFCRRKTDPRKKYSIFVYWYTKIHAYASSYFLARGIIDSSNY